MENFDLMSFNSPEQKGTESNAKYSLSPGGNPFDVLSKDAHLQFVEGLIDVESFMKCGDITGRESLGILKLETLNTSFNGDYFLHNPSSINITHQKSKDVIDSPLNVAYLQLPFFRAPSKTVSISSGSRFNSESLEASELSNICSANFEHSENILNDAFLSSKLEKRPKSACTLDPIIEVKQKPILSLPDAFNKSDSDFVQHDSKVEKLCDSFNDSVFMEANNVAFKIANGSLLLNDNCVQEVSLDCESPPKLVDLDEEELPINNADSVFKQVNKLLPQEDNKHDNGELCQKEEVKKNLSNIFENVQRRRSSSSSGSTRDPNEILLNLSAIINNDRRDSKQSQEGRQLLYSLADILCAENLSKSKCDHLDDSGHSSIEQEEQNDQDVNACFEVFDVRMISKSNDDMQALDLSTKNKTDGSRRLSQSFTLPSPPKLFNRLKSHSTSGSSISSSKVGSVKTNVSKLKPKKIEDKRKSTKGPLKAVIPVMDMAKGKSVSTRISNVTPPKLPVSSIFTTKRTSTPISEPQLKPVAQSTPGIGSVHLERNKPNSCSSQLKKRKFYCPISPLVQENSIDPNSTKSSQSTSTPNLSSQSKKDSAIPSPKFMYRRHSATELKTTEAKAPLTRSYSIGAGNKPNIVNKLKKTVSAVANSSLKKNIISPIQKNAMCESNSATVKYVKPSSLLGKLKRSKSDKENCPRK
ncbi:hypothetical protein RI129_005816 [Pyrocoelia pectoralis]|uniref:Uncharacterized protein n=1 Tax=Pyrocoelia pectoralis TaxID=417401 RepID=A0AAN7VFA8_9COLE